MSFHGILFLRRGNDILYFVVYFLSEIEWQFRLNIVSYNVTALPKWILRYLFEALKYYKYTLTTTNKIPPERVGVQRHSNICNPLQFQSLHFQCRRCIYIPLVFTNNVPSVLIVYPISETSFINR